MDIALFLWPLHCSVSWALLCSSWLHFCCRNTQMLAWRWHPVEHGAPRWPPLHPCFWAERRLLWSHSPALSSPPSAPPSSEPGTPSPSSAWLSTADKSQEELHTRNVKGVVTHDDLELLQLKRLINPSFFTFIESTKVLTMATFWELTTETFSLVSSSIFFRSMMFCSICLKLNGVETYKMMSN